MEPELNTVNGYGQLKTKNIVISNSNTFNKIANELKIDKYKKVDLNDIDLNFSIVDGKVSIEPFKAKYSNNEALIGGIMNLDQTIDFGINLSIPRSEFGGAANQVVDNLTSQAASKGLKIEPGDKVKLDVKIGGTVTNPTIKLNLQDMANNMMDNLKDKAKEELDKQKAELERKAKAEADKLKAQAEAEAQRLKAEAEQKAKQATDKAKAEAERLKKQAEAEAAKKKKEAEDKAKEEAKKQLNKLF
jgi:hypothetical protein